MVRVKVSIATKDSRHLSEEEDRASNMFGLENWLPWLNNLTTLQRKNWVYLFLFIWLTMTKFTLYFLCTQEMTCFSWDEESNNVRFNCLKSRSNINQMSIFLIICAPLAMNRKPLYASETASHSRKIEAWTVWTVTCSLDLFWMWHLSAQKCSHILPFRIKRLEMCGMIIGILDCK